tara:strand:- start:1460 stop:2155 length:696 start_codon:yes stop_codon:yes gene_type:complete
MSIGNTKSYGNKGNNFPFQLSVLEGLQCACDQLQLVEGNTDQIEGTLLSILGALQNGQDFEALLVVDALNVTWLEVRIYDPSIPGFLPPVYYLAGSNLPGTPTAPITYINPNTYLAQITAYTFNLIGMASSLNSIQLDATALPIIALNTGSNVRSSRFLRETGLTSVLPLCYSVSFASIGTADALINSTALSPGQSISFEAGSLNNYFNAGDFTADTQSNVGAELLITFIY